jgi:predicted GTPase
VFVVWVFVVAWLLTPIAYADGADQWCTDKQTAIKVRDKARAFEQFCKTVQLSVLPPDLAALCGDVSKISDMYAKAKRTDQAIETAERLQRKYNTQSGRLAECQTESKRWARRFERKSDEVAAERQKRQTFQTISTIAGGAAVVVGALLVFEYTGVTRFGPR